MPQPQPHTLDPDAVATLPGRITVWSPHGGTGCTTVAVAIAAAISRTRPAILRGSSPRHAAQIAEPLGLALALDAEVHSPRDVGPGLTLAGPLVDPHALDATAVDVVDLGARHRWPDHAQTAPGYVLAVIPGTYHALRQAVGHPAAHRTHGAIVATTPADVLGAVEVRDVLGWPVVATLPQDGAIRRASDAGTVAVRTPRALAEVVAQVVEAIADQYPAVTA